MSFDEWYLRPAESYEVERDGIRAEVPVGWDCRIGKQFESGEGELAFLVLHAATKPLTGLRADYGGGVVETLGTTDVFVALIEYGPAESNSALFQNRSALPTLEVSQFHRNQLQRRIRPQAGVQHFFTIEGRPFCLYVVLGSIANGRELVQEANMFLEGVTVGGRS